jgi:hypothetical protein
MLGTSPATPALVQLLPNREIRMHLRTFAGASFLHVESRDAAMVVADQASGNNPVGTF